MHAWQSEINILVFIVPFSLSLFSWTNLLCNHQFEILTAVQFTGLLMIKYQKVILKFLILGYLVLHKIFPFPRKKQVVFSTLTC